MFIHLQKSVLQIRKESFISSDFGSTPLPFFSLNLQIRTQLEPQTATSFTPNHLHAETHSSIHQSLSSPPHYPPNSPTLTQQNRTGSLRHNESFNNQTVSQTPISSPHRRPIMTQNSSTLPSTITCSSRRNQKSSLLTDSWWPSFSCCRPFPTRFSAKFFTFELFTHIRCVRLLRVHFRFFIVLSLSSIYFFISNHCRSFLLDFLSVIAFSASLLISLNLAVPRLPSIRLFFARFSPIKLCSSFAAKNPPQPVLWSIGSKPKPEKSTASGFWVQVYSNGDVYEREFHKGKSSGSGVYHYHLSGKYEGDWIDGKYDGYGVETWARGSRYRGKYRQGLRHGIGIYRFYTGDVYAGEWSNGQCHGRGAHISNDGSWYIGEFKWGVKHGLGHYHFRNGDIYAGEYFADKMHGFGVYQFQNGQRYEGAWHEGRRQGLGVYTFKNGETQSGHWQNGVFDDSEIQNSHSGFPCAVNDTKVFNAVQDACCAAEKAYTMVKVDEGVNKVVAAANKAANAARVAAVKAVQNKLRQSTIDK